MSWIGPRSRPQQAWEVVQALAFSKRFGGGMRHPKQVRHDWLYTRLSLLPRHVDITGGPVLDVGANAGDWTAALLRLVPRAQVIALEPAPSMAVALRDRFGGTDNVVVREVAASASHGEVTFHLTAHSHNSSLRAPRDMNAQYGVATGWEEVAEVQVATAPLDALLDEFGVPSLVKIDVQGAEALVLEGAQRTLRRAQAVLIEVTERSHYEDDTLGRQLHMLMEKANFVEVGRSDPWLDAVTGAPLWYDACYVRR